MTIRDIPDEVRDALAVRAARSGQSLQEHIRAELIELARRPSASELLMRIRVRKSKTESAVTTKKTLASLRDDRR